MTQPSDTAPEAEHVLTAVYRRISPAEKWLRLGRLGQDAQALRAAGERLRGDRPTEGPTVTSLEDLRAVVTVLDRLGIAYALGGSMASSVHGVERFTRDADLTVEPFPGREADLVAGFGPDSYVSEAAVRRAVTTRSSFNVINTASGFKVDVFVCKDDVFERGALARRLRLTFPDAPGQPVYLHTAEDVVLFKLRWYRLGNESSEQQWKDVLGVLRVQGDRLDRDYLDRWGAHLGVADLLGRARREAADLAGPPQ
jgi:hypothetical protein